MDFPQIFSLRNRLFHLIPKTTITDIIATPLSSQPASQPAIPSQLDSWQGAAAVAAAAK